MSMQMTSVERVKHYSQIDQESDGVSSNHITNGWPQNGSIVFDNMHLKYKGSEHKALKGISLEVQNREKVIEFKEMYSP